MLNAGAGPSSDGEGLGRNSETSQWKAHPDRLITSRSQITNLTTGSQLHRMGGSSSRLESNIILDREKHMEI
jgi:hypothetical protein